MRKLYAYAPDSRCPVQEFLQSMDAKIQDKLRFQLAYILDERNSFVEPYTATPQTLGALANGYPQRPLEDFIALNKDAHPILENLTRIEYVAATQAAVWATLG